MADVEPFQIILCVDFWKKRWLVIVEPRTATYPTRSFIKEADAEAFVAELAKITGWPVRDLRDGDDGKG